MLLHHHLLHDYNLSAYTSTVHNIWSASRRGRGRGRGQGLDTIPKSESKSADYIAIPPETLHVSFESGEFDYHTGISISSDTAEEFGTDSGSGLRNHSIEPEIQEDKKTQDEESDPPQRQQLSNNEESRTLIRTFKESSLLKLAAMRLPFCYIYILLACDYPNSIWN